MSDFELFVATVRHCGPWLAVWLGGTWLLWRIYKNRKFKQYEQERREYSKWRTTHLDEIK